MLGLPRSPVFLILEVVCFLGEFGNATAQAAVGPFALSFIAYFLPMLAILLFLPILLLRGLRRGNADARVLLLAILIFSVSTYWVFAGWIAYYLHLTPHSPRSPSLTFSTYSISLALSSRICFYFAILLFLVLRTIRIARDRAHYAAEVEAAQTVQQVLLSRSAQDTPGFKVETVYLPASEVGGDFFLVSPGSDGALIALVGDVAGKGMLAAMRVSVILGALRREEARQPSAILEGLNDAMLRQGDMGMTTACCIRVEPEGRFTVANAGHISPYIAGPDRGQEFVTEGALPLGIVAGTAYKQTAGSLNPGESLVLMSDGVVEARSEKLGLYGFERLAPLTRLPAREIAETAKAFGQEDDITVVTVSCTG